MALARVAELADALDLGSSTERCAGSIPVSRIYFDGNGLRRVMVRRITCLFLANTPLTLHSRRHPFATVFNDGT